MSADDVGKGDVSKDDVGEPDVRADDVTVDDGSHRSGITVDATGLRCPLPIIRLAAVARTARPGTVITLLSTDAAAEPDVAAWCRMRDQRLLDQTWDTTASGRTLISRIELR